MGQAAEFRVQSSKAAFSLMQPQCLLFSSPCWSLEMEGCWTLLRFPFPKQQLLNRASNSHGILICVLACISAQRR